LLLLIKKKRKKKKETKNKKQTKKVNMKLKNKTGYSAFSLTVQKHKHGEKSEFLAKKEENVFNV